MDPDDAAPSPPRPRASKSTGEGGASRRAPATTPGTTRSRTRPATAPGSTSGESTPSPAPGNGPGVPALAQDGLRWPEAALASLDLQRGAIGRLDAQDVTVTQGAIGAARAESITVDRGALGAAMANEIHASQAGISTLLAGQARIGQAAVRTIIARDVVVERPSLVGFLLARRVSGDVRVLFDWRGALVFGAVFGLLVRIGRGRR